MKRKSCVFLALIFVFLLSLMACNNKLAENSIVSESPIVSEENTILTFVGLSESIDVEYLSTFMLPKITAVDEDEKEYSTTTEVKRVSDNVKISDLYADDIGGYTAVYIVDYKGVKILSKTVVINVIDNRKPILNINCQKTYTVDIQKQNSFTIPVRDIGASGINPIVTYTVFFKGGKINFDANYAFAINNIGTYEIHIKALDSNGKYVEDKISLSVISGNKKYIKILGLGDNSAKYGVYVWVDYDFEAESEIADNTLFMPNSPVLFNGVASDVGRISKAVHPQVFWISNFGGISENSNPVKKGDTVKFEKDFMFSYGEEVFVVEEGYYFIYDGNIWSNVSEQIYSFSDTATLVLNEDADIFARFYNTISGDVSNLEQKSENYFDNRWANKGISDLLFNIENAVPTNGGFWLGSKYTLTTEHGYPVDYSNNTYIKAPYDIYTNGNADPVKIWIDKCRANSINPWVSFRMNDVHDQRQTTYPTRSEFGYLARERGWLIGSDRDFSGGWYDCALDYSVSEVRQDYLTRISNILNKYDVYGIELDWQREIYCFTSQSTANCVYMNQFMSDLSAIIRQAENKYGHEIKVMARLMRDLEQNKTFGFDTLHWAAQDWIDVIVPSSGYGGSDSDIPIAEWVDAFTEYGVEIYAGMEIQSLNENTFHSSETVAALSNAYLGAGAKKIYLFNFFDSSGQWKCANSLRSIMSIKNHRYVVMAQNVTANGYTRWQPLPMLVNSVNSISIQTGVLKPDARDKIMILGVYGTSDITARGIDNVLSVTAGGVKCEYIGITTNAYNINSSYKLYAFRVSSNVQPTDNRVKIDFKTSSNITIRYIEFFVGAFSL